MTTSFSGPHVRLPVSVPSRSLSPDGRAMATVLERLERGELVYDRAFDEVFPWQARRASSVHWTPVEVAVRAAVLLTEGVATPAILDIGAGIGKFCLVAAAVRRRARIHGIEHRRHFVDVSRAAASRLGVDVDLMHSSVAEHDPSPYTGFYLFNPFAENVAAREDHLDETVELCREIYWRDVAATQTFFARARVGARIVTYCGWGGTLPPGYELVSSERCAGPLELWEKRQKSAILPRAGGKLEFESKDRDACEGERSHGAPHDDRKR